MHRIENLFESNRSKPIEKETIVVLLNLFSGSEAYESL